MRVYEHIESNEIMADQTRTDTPLALALPFAAALPVQAHSSRLRRADDGARTPASASAPFGVRRLGVNVERG